MREGQDAKCYNNTVREGQDAKCYNNTVRDGRDALVHAHDGGHAGESHAPANSAAAAHFRECATRITAEDILRQHVT